MTSQVDTEFDVVVVGSGAGGLSAAVAAAHGGARVLVVEKADTCGGATAWSGGWMWAPRHRFARADGVFEDVEVPKTYLRNRLGDNFDEARVDAYLAGAPAMVDFFEERTALQFVPGTKIADIHGATPGAADGHRQVAPKPVRLTKLGKDVAALLRRQMWETSFLGMGIMAGPDLQAFLHSTRSTKAFALHCPSGAPSGRSRGAPAGPEPGQRNRADRAPAALGTGRRRRGPGSHGGHRPAHRR